MDKKKGLVSKEFVISDNDKMNAITLKLQARGLTFEFVDNEVIHVEGQEAIDLVESFLS